MKYRALLAGRGTALALTVAAAIAPTSVVRAEAVTGHYAAIATHPDVLDAWIFGGETEPKGEQTVKRKAHEACTQAMGAGCMVETWANDHLILSRNALGMARFSLAPTKEQALADARKGCDERWQLPCEILISFGAKERSHLADPVRNRKTHAFVMWVKTASGEVDPRAWIASGYRTGADARQAALLACTAQSGGKACEEVASVANGVLQAFTAGDNKVAFIAESNVGRAREAMQYLCKTQNATHCAAQIAYPSSVTGVYMHDFASGKAK